MRALKIAGSAKLPRVAALLVAVAGVGLAGCDDHAGDPKMQIGANPVLPPLQQYLMPPCGSQKLSDGERTKLRRWRRDCRSMHWLPAFSIRGRSTSFPMETCW